MTFSLAYGLYKGVIDNYLAEIVGMSGFDKGVSEFFRELPGLLPKRADVILAGACILTDILLRLDAPQLTISDRGLRHGLAFDLLN